MQQLYFDCKFVYQIYWIRYRVQNKLDNNLAYCHIKLIIKLYKKRQRLFPGGDLPNFFRIFWSELYFKIG